MPQRTWAISAPMLPTQGGRRRGRFLPVSRLWRHISESKSVQELKGERVPDVKVCKSEKVKEVPDVKVCKSERVKE